MTSTGQLSSNNNMPQISNITPNKQQLIQQMLNLCQQSKFPAFIEQTLKQILQCRSVNPYSYLHKKSSLKSKFQPSKQSQYIIQLAMYMSTINPLTLQKQVITNKIMSLCIEKYNHLKIRKSETNQFVNFILIDFLDKEKESFINRLNQLIDNQTINIITLGNVLYYTVLFKHALKQYHQITNKIKAIVGLEINQQIFIDYLNNVDQQHSILKTLKLQDQPKQGQNIQTKIVLIIIQMLKNVVK